MDKKEFLELVWQLDEILMQSDYLRNQIDTCEQGCGDDEGLCPKCSELFEEVLAEDKRLNGNKELDDIMKKLKIACDADFTGEYQRILNAPRSGGVVH